MPRHSRDLRGIRRHGNLWEVTARINGELHRTAFALDTPPAVMQAWRRREKERFGKTLIAKKSLADYARLYEQMIGHMPTKTERIGHVALWVEALGGDRSPYTVTTAEIQTVLSTWAERGHRGVGNPQARVGIGRPLAPQTLKHRWQALVALYESIEPGGFNPARAVKLPEGRPVEARAVPLRRIAAVLAQLARSHRPGRATLARLLVLLTTGLSHKTLMRLTSDDLDLTTGVLRVPGRRKGAGAAGSVRQLSPAACEAFRILNQEDAWGEFSPSAMHSAVARAAKAAKVPAFRPYDLRHTYASLLYQATGDLATVARALGQTSTAQTERYAREAFLSVDVVGQAKVSKQLAGIVAKPRRTGRKRRK